MRWWRGKGRREGCGIMTLPFFCHFPLPHPFSGRATELLYERGIHPVFHPVVVSSIGMTNIEGWEVRHHGNEARRNRS
jgi:hypothetical protein